MSAFLKWCAVSLLAFAFVVPTWPMWRRYQNYRRDKAHNLTFEYEDLKTLHGALIFLIGVEGKTPVPVENSTKLELTGTQLYGLLSESDDAMALARYSGASRERKAFIDRWGNEIHATLTHPGYKLHIRLWSNGPNGRNEEGVGDDVAFEGEVDLPRRK